VKDWQHGIELERLRAIALTYERHNAFALSPFAQFKKNNIAEAIHRKEFVELDGASYCIKRSSRDVKVTMFQDVVIAIRRAGDLVMTHANFTAAGRLHLLNAIRRHASERNLWLHIFEEDEASKSLARMAGFKKIGTKFTSFAEIIGVYFKRHSRALFKDEALVERRAQPVPPSELLTLERLRREPVSPVSEREIDHVVKAHVFTNHYSNYNKGKSWSALALRGYSDDIGCIIKPSEMPDSWQKENASKTWRLQWTHLLDWFKSVRQCCGELCENEAQIQRVRLMKLAPAGGELRRHTDQTDAESGTRERQFMRIHLPIVTNDQVLFTAWGCDGAPMTLNMKVGDAYYLDTRKPHRAVNGGATDRIHLVVDVQANAKLMAMLP
jgi:hypothetical protein